MRVLIFYNSKEIEKSFGSLCRSRNSVVELRGRNELGSCLSVLERSNENLADGAHGDGAGCGDGRSQAAVDLLYLDVSGMPAAQRTKSLRRLLAINRTAVGILDPQDDLADPAAWIREGAADYIGAKAGALRMKPSRFEEVLKWRNVKPESVVEQVNGVSSPQLPNLIPSPTQWSRIHPGTEYSFVMMYVGLDLELGVSTNSRAAMLQNSLKDFRAALKEQVSPFHGRLWFWKDTAGLVLFPFDGESGDAIVAAMRIVLGRLFWQAEGRTNYITKNFRLAIDVGNTVYSDGSQRETLVSDMVNYMFHLGGKHAKDGQCVISEEMLSRCPEGLRSYFVPCGSFG
ncbi:MAG: hypothetical protein EA428_11665, partial [Spirochaetaceae bacterium]